MTCALTVMSVAAAAATLTVPTMTVPTVPTTTAPTVPTTTAPTVATTGGTPTGSTASTDVLACGSGVTVQVRPVDFQGDFRCNVFL